MIDSGSGITTISPDTVRRLGLTTVPHDGKLTIVNADGSATKGGWTESVRAWVDTGISQGNMEIAVLKTNNDQFILGHDWMTRYKPRIDFSTGVIQTNYGRRQLAGTEYAVRNYRKPKK